MSKHSETPPPPGGQFLVYQTQDGNPPFNDSDWFRKDDDVRWQFPVCLWFLAKSNNTDAGLKGPGYAL